VIALGVVLGTATTAAASAPPRLAPPKSYYLALGDSIAYGFQTSKALAGLPPDAFNTGYIDLFATRLRRLQPRRHARQVKSPAFGTARRHPIRHQTYAPTLVRPRPGRRHIRQYQPSAKGDHDARTTYLLRRPADP
jgi:hypothetical protein